MSVNPNYRLAVPILLADRETEVALGAIAGYQPFNEAFSVAGITAARGDMEAAQENEILAETALAAARDAAGAAEWRYHEAILGAKDQVVAQFGVNSDQVQSLGLKKKSERKRPSRSAPAPEPPPDPAS